MINAAESVGWMELSLFVPCFGDSPSSDLGTCMLLARFLPLLIYDPSCRSFSPSDGVMYSFAFTLVFVTFFFLLGDLPFASMFFEPSFLLLPPS